MRARVAVSGLRFLVDVRDLERGDIGCLVLLQMGNRIKPCPELHYPYRLTLPGRGYQPTT